MLRKLLTKLLPLAALGFMLAASGAANAVLLINSQPTNPGATDETLIGRSVMTAVEVGASNVAINQFGTFGELVADGNVKFVIFAEGAGNTPLFSTTAIAVAAGGGHQWYDSPLFSFSLLANSTYWMGLMADSAFTYTHDFPGAAVSANGLTLPAQQNGNAENFNNPVSTVAGSVLQSIRIFGPAAVPEPATALMIGLGLAGIGVIRRRTRRS